MTSSLTIYFLNLVNQAICAGKLYEYVKIVNLYHIFKGTIIIYNWS